MIVREKTLARGTRIDSVNNASDFTRICRDNMHGVHVHEVKEREITDLNSTENLWAGSIPIPGIKNIRCIKVFPDGKIEKI